MNTVLSIMIIFWIIRLVRAIICIGVNIWLEFKKPHIRQRAKLTWVDHWLWVFPIIYFSELVKP
jgi:hypothetical protein